MTDDGARYAILKEEDKPLLLEHCSRHVVGFISDHDADFYQENSYQLNQGPAKKSEKAVKSPIFPLCPLKQAVTPFIG
jgi:hypothetical protein